jgi:hypothetical protein
MKDDAIPKWLRYGLIVIGILYLLAIIFGKQGKQREDFPAHAPRTK